MKPDKIGADESIIEKEEKRKPGRPPSKNIFELKRTRKSTNAQEMNSI